MDTNNILNEVRRELKQNSEPENRKIGKTFFKEEVRLYGVKTATVTQIAKKYFKEISDQKKSEVFGLCEQLWQSGYTEESYIACNWAYALRKDYEPDDFIIFEKWLHLYVVNWASCDTLCNHTIGTFIEMYPEYLPELKLWAKAENRWVRRGSAVTLIVPARDGKFLKEVLEISELLLMDDDDLVQKGYGWLMKAASESHQKEIFDYVMSKKEIMSRTALRYAIEKMPDELRAAAMDRASKSA
ncbi:DNA alkylation repair protein [Aliifodinibius salicampi]|uniref:DNA alkylation repair protein n=1 Tax=Fodinibius salicampi TaxID=1920655 RepID=A0ABT3PUA4_9BACT|nr:DNA alkylation repair protein [Fodinibius salicampi]MCW9711435.1 DNA alkylation repair protein [Fodinibius salicampi]